MERSTDDKKTDQLNKPKKEDRTHQYLIAWVIITAIVSILVYGIWLRDWPLSKSASDWANFATYLSGTVGVAAVVGTLIAITKTLRQQQELINSQNALLEQQKTQIIMNQKKLDDEVLQRSLEKAYRNVIDVFPLLIEDLRNSIRECVRGDLVAPIVNHAYQDAPVVLGYIYSHPSDLLQYFKEFEASDKNEYEIAVLAIFSGVARLIPFIEKNLEISSDLYICIDHFLRSNLGLGHPGWFYLECYNEFQRGIGGRTAIVKNDQLTDYSVNFEETVDILYEWYEIGVLLQDKPAK